MIAGSNTVSQWLQRLRRLAPITLLAIAVSPRCPSETPDQAPPGDPVRGQSVYHVCMACHSIDEDDVGPRHRGVVGRAAGSVAGYAYSAALRRSGLTWDPVTLDRWLKNPQQLVPGTKMFFAMPNPQDRADVIAYLAQLR